MNSQIPVEQDNMAPVVAGLATELLEDGKLL